MNPSETYYNSLLSSIKSSLLADTVTETVNSSQYLERAEELASAGCVKNAASNYVVSIFHGLEGSKRSEKRSFPKMPMTLTDAFFPVEKPVDDLTNLKNAFKKDFAELSGDSDVKAESLLYLLYKYGTGLPAGYGETISLYDFAKIKAAFAVCLQQLDATKQPEKFLLIGGAMSGVQSYLYDIVSAKASKNLKGRSFYLHLLIDSCIFSLLNSLGLPRACVLYASGGAFFIIAPFGMQDSFEAWKKKALDEIFSAYNMRLFLEADYVAFDSEALEGDRLAGLFNDLHDKLTEQKKQPFAHQLIENFDNLFEPHELGGEARRDAITGDEIEKGDAVDFDYETGQPEEERQYISRKTDEIQKLGEWLRNTQYWVTSNDEIPGFKNFIRQLGVYHYFLETREAWPAGCLVRQLNRFDFEKSASIFGFEFYGGNSQPMVELKFGYAPKTFSEMAGEYDSDRVGKKLYKQADQEPWKKINFKRLGVLRMDVDGLGTVFQNKKGRNLKSLAHYSALSRLLDWFFKGYLNHIWSTGFVGDKADEYFLYRFWTQIIYAGGDDLFLVGRWDCLLDMAQKIRDAFQEFACNNEKLSLSGGIAMVTHKFPVMKAAEQAGDAEEQAKRHKKETVAEGKPELIFTKNSFTLLGQPLYWDSEFRIVRELKKRLVDARQKKMPQSVLMKLFAFHEQREHQRQNSETESWRWRTAYDLARARERMRGDPATMTLLDELSISIFTDRYREEDKRLRKADFFDLLIVASRWAELELRRPEVKSDNSLDN